MTRRFPRLAEYADALKQSDSARSIFCGHALDGLRGLLLVCWLPVHLLLSIEPLGDILIFGTLFVVVGGPSVLGGWLIVNTLGLDPFTSQGALVFVVTYVAVFAVGTYPAFSTLGDVLAKYDTSSA